MMTEPILDAMRYFTPFGYDVLSFVLVDRLASTGRDKLKADGLNISDWLQVLRYFPNPLAYNTVLAQKPCGSARLATMLQVSKGTCIVGRSS